MPATLNIITEDDIFAYVHGVLPKDVREDVENAIEDDPRAEAAFLSALAETEDD